MGEVGSKVAAPGDGPGAPKMGRPVPMQGRPVQGQPPSDGVPYMKLMRWGWVVVSPAFAAFAINIGLSLADRLLAQYNAVVLGALLPALGQGGGGEPARGFLGHLLPSGLPAIAVTFAVVGILVIIASIANRMVQAWSNNVMLGRLQCRLHDRLLRLGPVYHTGHDVSRTSLVVLQYATGAQQFLREMVAFPLTRGISLVTAIALMVDSLMAMPTMPVGMALSLGAVLVLMPLAGWLTGGSVRKAFERVNMNRARLSNEFLNSAGQPLEVQLMGAREQRSRSFAAVVGDVVRAATTANLRMELSSQIQSQLPTILQTAILIFGAFLVVQSGDPGVAAPMLAIYFLVPQVVTPVQEIVSFAQAINQNWPVVQEVVEILDQPEPMVVGGDLALTPSDRAIAFKDVVFGYTPEVPPILTGLSHTFRPGTVSAIVARSGAGKSSLLNLVARLQRPQGGLISIGDKPLGRIEETSLHRSIVKISQFPLFINDTVRANFRLAKGDASDGEIEAVCRRTGLWDILVRNAPPGAGALDLVLPRETSQGLSGGQRRLLAITRALLLEPGVLLLDELTTGIDAIGRQMLATILRPCCTGLTVLMVDHDMEFVRAMADEVCCLEDGRFSDVGTPAELLERPNLFRQLCDTQKSLLAAPAQMDVVSVPLPRLIG